MRCPFSRLVVTNCDLRPKLSALIPEGVCSDSPFSSNNLRSQFVTSKAVTNSLRCQIGTLKAGFHFRLTALANPCLLPPSVICCNECNIFCVCSKRLKEWVRQGQNSKDNFGLDYKEERGFKRNGSRVVTLLSKFAQHAE